jgi:hypothetical protein
MASLDSLTPDQRAVLDLVLRRGRSYDDIARLLAIDRAAVRARALAAFDAIGPETGITAESRALITDYLLGQLPERVAEQTRERLTHSPYDSAWARVVASELEQVADQPLPEIPDATRGRAPASEASSGTARAADASRAQERQSASRPPRRRPARLSDRPSSRRGGAIMLGVGVIVVAAVAVGLAALLNGGSKKNPSPAASVSSSSARTSTAGTTTAGTTTAGSTTAGTTTGTSTSQAQIVAQVNLNPPSGGSAKGVGLVVKDGSAYGLIIEAQNVAPNDHNAYAAWLYNSPTDSLRLGFVNPAVGKTGKLQVGTALPAKAGHYKQLILTLETQSAPKTPGTIVLQGPLTGLPAAS